MHGWWDLFTEVCLRVRVHACVSFSPAVCEDVGVKAKIGGDYNSTVYLHTSRCRSSIAPVLRTPSPSLGRGKRGSAPTGRDTAPAVISSMACCQIMFDNV